MSTYIKHANHAFCRGDYAEAIMLYQKSKDSFPELAKFIEFNLKLSEWRMSKGVFYYPNSHFIRSAIVIGIITPPHTMIIAEALAKRLFFHGFNVTIYDNSPGDFCYDYYFVLCPQIFDRLPPGEKRICFQLEQSISDRWFTNEYLEILENSFLVIDYSLVNIRYLNSLDIKYPMVYYLPLGGIEELIGLSVNKDIDVLFYGDSLSCQRRREMLDELKKYFKVEIENNLFGNEIREKIRRSKVVLNLHYYEDSLLEAPRIMECISLGTMVVSELAKDSEDYECMNKCIRYFEEGSLEDMVIAVKSAIDSPIPFDTIIDSVGKLESRFNFMLDRLLIASDIIPVEKCDSIIIDFSSNVEGVCLSMPETIVRRDMFTALDRKGVVIFDGIRKSPGWIGCGLSYKTIARSALHHGVDNLMVMEDDVELPADFDYKLDVVKKYLGTISDCWDLFSGLIANVHPDSEVLRVDDFNGIRFVTINKMTSTVCNIYNKPFFERIAGWNPRNIDSTTNTIDRYIESIPGLRVVTTLPFLVGHREDAVSALWNFQNTQYADMFKDSINLLNSKVNDFLSNQ